MVTLDDLLVAGQGKRYSGYIALVCPFHKSYPIRPSLFAWQDGWFRCASCGKSGRNEYLLDVLRGRPVRISLQENTEWSPPSLPTEPEKIAMFCDKAHQTIVDNPSMGWYYETRGVEEMIEPALLGWYNGWATIPIQSEHNAVLGVVIRAGPHIEKANEGIRFHQPRGQKSMMYCPNWNLLLRSNKVAIVFGIFDALAMAAIHIPVVTSIAGKDSFKPHWLDSIWSGSALIIPDKKEEITAYKLRKDLSLVGIHNDVLLLDYPDKCKDPADYLQQGKRKQLEKIMARFMR